MRGKAGLFSRFQPFSPTLVSGLTGWWDASDSATLFDATTGGSAVAADGGVARWEDKSGNGRHWFQANSGQRPSRKTSVKNSRDVIRLDGSSDRMQSSASSPTAWQWQNMVTSAEWSAFAVAKAASISTDGSGGSVNANQWIVGEAGSSNAAFYFRSSGLVGGLVFGQGFNWQAPTASYTAGDWKTFSLVFDTSASFDMRVNGGTPGSVSSPSEPRFAGDYPWLGFTPNGSAYFDGDIAEIIFYNVALSATDREAVESYLIDKWAIT
jgi:hypothetical protein